jgi:hypothetical protein
MATREQLHKQIDAVPDDQLDQAHIVIVPDAAKPGDIVDEWGNLSAIKRASARRTIRRLSQEEDDAGLEPW